MAFKEPSDLTPDEWINTWSEDATNITIPLASLDTVDATDADGANGDIRQCVYGFLYQIEGTYRNRNINTLPTISKMQITKVASVDSDNDEEVITFTCTFRNARTVGDVAAEPS